MVVHLTPEEWRADYKNKLLKKQMPHTGWEYESGAPISTKLGNPEKAKGTKKKKAKGVKDK